MLSKLMTVFKGLTILIYLALLLNTVFHAPFIVYEEHISFSQDFHSNIILDKERTEHIEFRAIFDDFMDSYTSDNEVIVAVYRLDLIEFIKTLLFITLVLGCIYYYLRYISNKQ